MRAPPRALQPQCTHWDTRCTLPSSCPQTTMSLPPYRPCSVHLTGEPPCFTAKLVIIDEAVMLCKEYLDLIDSTMRDIEENPDSTFGGRCVFVLAGDFRQVLPVIRKGRIADQCDSCLRYSAVWSSGVVQQLTLTQNMRSVTAGQCREFAHVLLRWINTRNHAEFNAATKCRLSKIQRPVTCLSPQILPCPSGQ